MPALPFSFVLAVRAARSHLVQLQVPAVSTAAVLAVQEQYQTVWPVPAAVAALIFVSVRMMWTTLFCAPVAAVVPAAPAKKAANLSIPLPQLPAALRALTGPRRAVPRIIIPAVAAPQVHPQQAAQAAQSRATLFQIRTPLMNAAAAVAAEPASSEAAVGVAVPPLNPISEEQLAHLASAGPAVLAAKALLVALTTVPAAVVAAEVPPSL